MLPLVRNVLAVIVGFILASVVNMSLIVGGGIVVPPPEGADMNTAEGVRAAMARMTPVHFLVPFLAHALGTFVGGLVAALLASTHKLAFALVIGVIYFGLGSVMVGMVGGPLWFIVCDLCLAYVPMAWLGGKLGMVLTGTTLRRADDFA